MGLVLVTAPSRILRTPKQSPPGQQKWKGNLMKRAWLLKVWCVTCTFDDFKAGARDPIAHLSSVFRRPSPIMPALDDQGRNGNCASRSSVRELAFDRAAATAGCLRRLEWDGAKTWINCRCAAVTSLCPPKSCVIEPTAKATREFANVYASTLVTAPPRCIRIWFRRRRSCRAGIAHIARR